MFPRDKEIIKEYRKVIVIQATKALRDGKKQGVEDKTLENWENVEGENSFHTTFEGFKRNARNVNLEDYTIVVDESHLLEEYITFRTSVIHISFTEVNIHPSEVNYPTFFLGGRML